MRLSDPDLLTQLQGQFRDMLRLPFAQCHHLCASREGQWRKTKYVWSLSIWKLLARMLYGNSPGRYTRAHIHSLTQGIPREGVGTLHTDKGDRRPIKEVRCPRCIDKELVWGATLSGCKERLLCELRKALPVPKLGSGFLRLCSRPTCGSQNHFC